jgi:RNA polymerase sigma-70 factor (ECF subfamily)
MRSELTDGGPTLIVEAEGAERLNRNGGPSWVDLERLYRQHRSTLLAISRRIVRDHAESQDIVHDAILAMHERATQYSLERGSHMAWSTACVHNLSVDRVRRRNRRAELLQDVLPQLAPASADAEALLSNAEASVCLRKTIAELPALERGVVEMATFQGLSYPEIAARQNVCLGTIKSRVARAHARLRQALHGQPRHAPHTTRRRRREAADRESVA